MVKKSVLGILIIAPILLCSCSQSTNVNTRNNKELSKISISPQVALPQATSDENKNNFQNELPDLKGYLDKSGDSDLSEEVKKDNIDKFIQGINVVLNNPQSKNLSDNDFKLLITDSLTAITKSASLNGTETKIRVLRFDGSPKLFGTLEREWLFVQWWNNDQLNSSMLIEKGGEMVEDFSVINAEGNLKVVTIGRETEYSPSPVFAMGWALNSGRWDKFNCFGNDIVSNGEWILKVFDNELIAEKSKEGEEGMDKLDIKFNQIGNGFDIFPENNLSNKKQFKLEGEEFKVQD